MCVKVHIDRELACAEDRKHKCASQEYSHHLRSNMKENTNQRRQLGEAAIRILIINFV
jgi:hypothetical protein